MSDDQHRPPRPAEGGWGEQDSDSTGYLPLTGGVPGYADYYDYPRHTAAQPGADPLAAPGQGYPPPDLSGWQQPDPDPGQGGPSAEASDAHFGTAAAPLTPGATTDPASPGHWTLPFALGDGVSAEGARQPVADPSALDPLASSPDFGQGAVGPSPDAAEAHAHPLSSPLSSVPEPSPFDLPVAPPDFGQGTQDAVTGTPGGHAPFLSSAALSQGEPGLTGGEVWPTPADHPAPHPADGFVDTPVASTDWNNAPGGGGSGQWVIPPHDDRATPPGGPSGQRRPLADPDARRAPTPDPLPHDGGPAVSDPDSRGDVATGTATGPARGPDLAAQEGAGASGLSPEPGLPGAGGEPLSVFEGLGPPITGGELTGADIGSLGVGDPVASVRTNDVQPSVPEGPAGGPGPEAAPATPHPSWFGADQVSGAPAAEASARDAAPPPLGSEGPASAAGSDAERPPRVEAEPSDSAAVPEHTTADRAVPDPTPDSTLEDSEHPHTSYVLRINGADRQVADSWIGESLLYVLRERLGLAGAKDGCAQGECGACTVLVDGRLVASCLVPAATSADSEIRTVEGLATDGAPSDVQRALATHGAVQCGFCVPGLAMTLHALLEGIHEPTELEVRKAISGNLCRCSGYRGVLEAVRAVSAERAARGDAESPDVAAGPADQPPAGAGT